MQPAADQTFLVHSPQHPDRGGGGMWSHRGGGGMWSHRGGGGMWSHRGGGGMWSRPHT